MFNRFKNLTKGKKIALISVIAIILLAIIGSNSPKQQNNTTSTTAQSTQIAQICDGTSVTANCKDEDGVLYQTYLYHEATPEVTKTIEHPAEPEKSHVVHHDAEYGTREVKTCIPTSISYKSGTCALSQCRDGSYSGSTGRGTCSYHGGVARSGGPWYTYSTEEYEISAAWDETVVDEPAKDAWTETVVVTPAKEAYFEKIPADAATE